MLNYVFKKKFVFTSKSNQFSNQIKSSLKRVRTILNDYISRIISLKNKEKEQTGDVMKYVKIILA